MIETNNTTYKQYAAILIGGSLCLPVIMVGFELAQLFGTVGALIALGIGNVLLLCMALLMAKIAIATRQTTLGIAVIAFGRAGLPCFASMIVVLMLGWFTIQLDVISTNIHILVAEHSSLNVPLWAICIIVGLLMTVVSLKGLRCVGSVAGYIVVPVLMVLVIAFIVSWRQLGGIVIKPSVMGAGSLGASVSIVLAAMLGLVVDLPTLMCSAKTKADAYKSVILVFIFAVPLIELIGVLFASLGTADNILMRQLMTGSLLWQIIASLCFIASETISNIINLYSAAMNLQTAMPRNGLALYIILGGITATSAAAIGVAHNIIAMLNVLGFFMSSMGVGIIGWYIHDLYGFSYTRLIMFISLCSGILFGLCHLIGVLMISPSALLDAAIASTGICCIGTLGAQLLVRNRNNYKNIKEINGAFNEK